MGMHGSHRQIGFGGRALDRRGLLDGRRFRHWLRVWHRRGLWRRRGFRHWRGLVFVYGSGIVCGRGRVHWLVQGNLALAAIAASPALRTEVVGAGILGTPYADARGFLSTDRAIERHGYFFSVLGAALGCLARMPRQRCAS